MLPDDRDYHIVWDRKATHPYLAWKQDGEFWIQGMCGDDKIDRVIVSSVPVVLPHPTKKKKNNGWTRCDVDKPNVKMYECSPDVLVYDSHRGYICECFYTYTPSGSEWCDSESMGPYDRRNFDPDFWMKLPTIDDMEYLAGT
jgi:hypothetical protein